MIYNGYLEIEAKNYDEAQRIAEEALNVKGACLFPKYGNVGKVSFVHGETTLDYLDED